MALVKGSNSYVSVSEADAYLYTRWGAERWNELTCPLKERALITATRTVDSYDWVGVVLSEDQELSFPRRGHHFDGRIGQNVALPDVVPREIEDLTCEIAFYISSEEDDGGISVEHFKLDVIELKGNLIRSKNLPATIFRASNKLRARGDSHSWWRAN
jgi:hypothetical protein